MEDSGKLGPLDESASASGLMEASSKKLAR